jgi:hypothetical protein
MAATAELNLTWISEIAILNFIPPFFYFKLCGHLGWKSASPDTILEGDHPRTIPPKFGCNWPSGFWGENVKC